ncbi:hypothetical protein [Ferrovibrio terrae]|uniref:hypothetical protein n=1 Tax=Ferrovibrio terrae TaxID=2594003 RepID=UPI00313804A2
MNRHTRRAHAAIKAQREAMPNTGLHYIQRRMPNGIVQDCEVKDLLQGDVYREMEPGMAGPWKLALANAERLPSKEFPGRHYWQVKSRLALKVEIPTADEIAGITKTL